MVINLNKESLIEATKKIGSVYGLMAKKDSAVINIQCAVINKNGNEIKAFTVTHFNGSTQISCNIKACNDTEIDGNISVNVGAEFISAVSALSNVSEDVISIKDDGGVIVIEAGTSSVSIKKKTEGVVPIEFDVVDRSTIEGQFVLSGIDFKNSAHQILFAALNEDNSSVGGVGIVARKNEVVFRATDKHRLAESTAKVQQAAFVTEGTTEIQAVVSPAVLKCVTGAFGKERMVFLKTKKHLVIQYGHDIWQMPVLDKKYPHELFEGVKKLTRNNTVEFNKAEMLVALDIVAVGIAGENVCCLSMEDNMLVISSRDGGNKATVSVTTSGEVPAVVYFSQRLLKTVVANFKSDSPVVELADQAPSAFYSEGENFYAALCPVKGGPEAEK